MSPHLAPADGGPIDLTDPLVWNWPTWLPVGTGIFMILLGVAVAAQRHLFTHPGLGIVALLVTLSPWIFDISGKGIEALLGHPKLVATAWCTVVIGGDMWLLFGFGHISNDFAPFFLVVLAGQITTATGPITGGVLSFFMIAGIISTEIAGVFFGALIWVFAICVGWAIGWGIRWLVRSKTELETAQAERAALTVEQERHHLAREVHDLIAHTLAVTMLHMTGARLALKDGATDEALEALVEAEAAGRRAMAEIHRTVALLGTPDANGLTAPTPSAADIELLVSDFEAAGLHVAFDHSSGLDEVPMAPGLAAYRIVQESLANAVKHAPGAPVQLDVQVDRSTICISVSNPTPAPLGLGSGNGLRGMAERAQLLGGSAVAEDHEGIWRVKAHIPLAAQAS
jgi:signal transduction histidine kinase